MQCLAEYPSTHKQGQREVMTTQVLVLCSAMQNQLAQKSVLMQVIQFNALKGYQHDFTRTFSLSSVAKWKSTTKINCPHSENQRSRHIEGYFIKIAIKTKRYIKRQGDTNESYRSCHVYFPQSKVNDSTYNMDKERTTTRAHCNTNWLNVVPCTLHCVFWVIKLALPNRIASLPFQQSPLPTDSGSVLDMSFVFISVNKLCLQVACHQRGSHNIYNRKALYTKHNIITTWLIAVRQMCKCLAHVGFLNYNERIMPCGWSSALSRTREKHVSASPT